ncbi:hypothetical protein BO94DRAFT_97472 [Aspergillus sclerotioniger CBS 115572]|uniref:Zn(2)-C6 fungal-type domain-containing protein n=1 Tax=Aspergillus sclerotioniger CBS 115572 TaxID=1450535 RepID=A0A317WHD9_9EURO|nr:hypothetical protein BO94DRAFT_97472 [Aspergillus sclerotioniger CBS 115572]PWY85783.1 hypothetical protein BO94DRAFT_97472 [Aspergillus sclerotioniger CBS 115572]
MKSAIRACTNCVRAKSRCTPHDSGTCARCVRLMKTCQPSPPVRKRRNQTKASVKDVQKLEEKLDGLVNILKSATQPGLLNGVVSTPEHVVPTHAQPVSLSAPLVQVLPDTAITPAPSFGHPENPSLEPNDDDAASYLNRFRSDFIGHLPFLVIPASLTASQLRQESPLLWLAIMTVASTRTTQQRGLSMQVRERFGREAYVEGTRNIDFLLAVLVYVTWDHHYSFDKPIFTGLLQLAIAILYDLGLDKPPSQDPGLLLSYDLKGTSRPSHCSRLPSMKERRALLGCFLVSFTSNLSGNGEPLQWTPYFDECLRVVEEQNESEHDGLLVQLVKLRLITAKVMDPWTGPTDSNIMPSASFYLQSLQSQLRDFRSRLPSELADNKTLQMELLNTEMMIYEVGFSAPQIFPPQSNQQFECLFACLQTIKSWTETVLTFRPAEYVGFTCLICSNMGRSLVNLYRLTTCDYPVWDRKLVQESVDVSWVLETAAQRFSQVKDAAGLDPEGSQDLDFFMIMAAKMEAMKLSWDTVIVPTTADSWSPSADDLEMFSNEFLTMWNW